MGHQREAGIRSHFQWSQNHGRVPGGVCRVWGQAGSGPAAETEERAGAWPPGGGSRRVALEPDLGHRGEGGPDGAFWGWSQLNRALDVSVTPITCDTHEPHTGVWAPEPSGSGGFVPSWAASHI